MGFRTVVLLKMKDTRACSMLKGMIKSRESLVVKKRGIARQSLEKREGGGVLNTRGGARGSHLS